MTWAALTLGWPPNVTRAQRHGDLLAVRDRMADEQLRAER